MLVDVVRAAREILGGLTPLNTDCGVLCAAACCAPDEEGKGGMYLFPGEREIISADNWAAVTECDGILGGRPTQLMVCGENCDRGVRPLACMIFPLTPYLSKDGELKVRIDARARPVCPLAPSGLRGLRPEFVDAVRRAMSLIASVPEGRAFIEDWQGIEEQYRNIF